MFKTLDGRHGQEFFEVSVDDGGVVSGRGSARETGAEGMEEEGAERLERSGKRRQQPTERVPELHQKARLHVSLIWPQRYLRLRPEPQRQRRTYYRH